MEDEGESVSFKNEAPDNLAITYVWLVTLTVFNRGLSRLYIYMHLYVLLCTYVMIIYNIHVIYYIKIYTRYINICKSNNKIKEFQINFSGRCGWVIAGVEGGRRNRYA